MIEEQVQESDVGISFKPLVQFSFNSSYLELVLAGLGLRGWVQKIDCENLNRAMLAIFWT